MSCRTEFDGVIGRLDRILSEFLLLSEGPLDDADWQTIKHHAGDLIGVGNKALENLQPGVPLPAIDPNRPTAKEEVEAFQRENPPWS